MICQLAKIEEVLENQWYEFSLQLDNGLVSVMLMYKDGDYIAFKNYCPHQGRRMDYMAGKFLTTESGNIVCPAHGAEFNANSGLCINGPCLGQSLETITIKTNEETIFAIVE